MSCIHLDLKDGKSFFVGTRFGSVYRMRETKNNRYDIEKVVKITTGSEKRRARNELVLNNVRAIT